MLTGDSRATADAVARTLGLDEVHAGVLPNQKGEIVKRLQAEGHVVAMAGDGVNDATALTQANVGIGRIRTAFRKQDLWPNLYPLPDGLRARVHRGSHEPCAHRSRSASSVEKGGEH